MSPFKVLGVLSVLDGCALAFLVVANTGARAAGGHDLRPLGSLALLSWVLGWGLYRHQKWAAVIFAAPLGLYGLAQAIASVGTVPMPWVIGNLVLGAILLLPAIITIRWWHLLRGKQET